jgi:hypothetical protein
VVLSDENYKNIREHADPKEIARALVEMGPPFDADELKYIHEQFGSDFGYNFDNAHDWTDDTLDKYAAHIKNYAYNYKPEAQKIDPSIDPNEKHIGPMAQDIEKVNPAAVKETEDGTKVVDANRLALMNAGAIAELARELKDMKGQHVEADSKGPTGGNHVLSDAGIKTDYTATFKPQYKKSMLQRIRGHHGRS